MRIVREELYASLPFFRTNDAIELMNHAVKTKLSYELKNDRHCTSAHEIILFIQNSLGYRSLKNITTCYEKIFSDALQIDVTGDPLLNMIKMDIADHMIRSLRQRKTSCAKDGLERSLAELEEKALRYKIFNSKQNYVDYSLIFSSVDSMQKLNAILQEIRTIHQIGWQALDRLDVLSKHSSKGPKEKWEEVCLEFKKFRDHLEKITISANEEEKKYIQSLGMVIDSMIRFIDSAWKVASVDEIERLSKNLQTSLAEHTKSSLHLFADMKIGTSKTNVDCLVSLLRLKKKSDLVIFTEKLKTFLMDNMAQAALVVTLTKVF